jgi:malate dehydrogenase (oxaloacetate-decarboxylating)
LLAAGVGDVIMCDRHGVIAVDRADGLNEEKRAIAAETNKLGVRGSLHDALIGADVFIGVSGPNLVDPEWVADMAKQSIVFAIANPVPEIMPEDIPDNVAVVATGRSDYPNQINNVLVFPGFFRGLLDVQATTVNEAMKVGAAHALAGLVAPDDLSPTRIVPSAFDHRVVPAVSDAVKAAVE